MGQTLTNPPLEVSHHSYLLDQPNENLELIFNFLPVADLARLSRSCRFLHKTIGSYLHHQVSSACLSVAASAFLSSNKELLTLNEQSMFAEIFGEKFSAEMGSCEADSHTFDSNKKLDWWLFKRKKYYQHWSTRISCSDINLVGFPHRNNPSYVPVEWHEKLKRDVVRVKSVCWLQVNTTFRNLKPGQYQVSLRIQILESFQWPHAHDEHTFITAQVKENDVDTGRISKVVLNQTWWRQVAENKSPSYTDADLLLHSHTMGATGRPIVEFDSCSTRNNTFRAFLRHLYVDDYNLSGWFTLSLPPVTLNRPGEVWFELKDTECPWWKSGLIFDFVEIRKLD